MNMILKARHFCQFKHKGQFDDDGKPYYEHPFKVAEILRHITLDEDILCAAFLHDTLEDTDTTYDDLVKELNAEAVVRGLRNGTDLQYEMNQQYWNEDLGLNVPIVYFITDRKLSHISSSAIREIKCLKIKQ